MRLASPEVKRLLNSGARLNASAASVMFSSRTLSSDEAANARLAVAVPKRLLKRAVDRNRAKRVLREAFRQGEIRNVNVDTLVTLTQSAKSNAIPRSRMMKSLRAAADALFHKIAAKNNPPIKKVA